jgi:hypothetical protein
MIISNPRCRAVIAPWMGFTPHADVGIMRQPGYRATKKPAVLRRAGFLIP